MAASKGGKAKKGARRARKAAPKPGARAGKGGAGTNKGAAVAGGAAKLDAARVRAWRLRGRQGVYRHEHKKRWYVQIHYGEQLHLGSFKTEEDAIALLFLAEDRIDAGCHPKTGKYVPEADRPKPPKTKLKNNAHLLGKPAQKFSDAALGEHATDLAAKVDAGTLDIDQVAGVGLHKANGKWRAKMKYKKKHCQLGSYTTDLAEAIRYRLLAEKAKALFPDKNPKDYVAARMAAAGGAAAAGKKRKRSSAPVPPQQHPRRRNTAPPNKAPPASITREDELRRLIAGKRKVVLALREALGRCATETEAHRREIARLRPQLGAAQREVAWLQVGDGQCARTRAYRHWQR